MLRTFTLSDPKPVLDPDVLYFGDNGRCFCGGCAGMSAKYTGHDISGQAVERVTIADAREFRAAGLSGPKCETCGKAFA